MEEKTLSIKLEFRRSQLLYVMTFFLITLNTKNLSPESVTLSTYYPAPAGVYNNMVTIGNTWLARDPVPATGQPSFLELGSNAAVSPGTKFSVMNGNVGIGTTDPSLGGQVGSIFTINAAATTGLAVADNGTPSFALNPQSDGSWQMFDHASGAWMQGLSQSKGMVDFAGQLGVGPGVTPSGTTNSYIHVNSNSCTMPVPTGSADGGACPPGIPGNACYQCPSGSYATWAPGIYVEGQWNEGIREHYSYNQQLNTWDSWDQPWNGYGPLFQVAFANGYKDTAWGSGWAPTYTNPPQGTTVGTFYCCWK